MKRVLDEFNDLSRKESDGYTVSKDQKPPLSKYMKLWSRVKYFAFTFLANFLQNEMVSIRVVYV